MGKREIKKTGMSGGQWEVLTEENAIVSVGRGGGINLGESLGRISLGAMFA